jgi:hypothetical protein
MIKIGFFLSFNIETKVRHLHHNIQRRILPLRELRSGVITRARISSYYAIRDF